MGRHHFSVRFHAELHDGIELGGLQLRRSPRERFGYALLTFFAVIFLHEAVSAAAMGRGGSDLRGSAARWANEAAHDGSGQERRWHDARRPISFFPDIWQHGQERLPSLAA